jgi:hypothetical protein
MNFFLNTWRIARCDDMSNYEINPLKPIGYYMYLLLEHKNSTFRPQSVFVCFIWSPQKAELLSLNSLNLLGILAET